MSIYKRKSSGIWHYDFQLKGSRFYGTTGVSDKIAAESIVRQIKENAAAIPQTNSDQHYMTLHQACAIYLSEKAQFFKSAKNAETKLKMIIKEFGKKKRMGDITEREIKAAVAKWRVGRTNTTVNHEFTERLRAVWNYAAPDIKQPAWKGILLKEPRERVREIFTDEQNKILQTLRPDLIPAFLFSLETGLRQSEMINLKWRDIDLKQNTIAILGKGDKPALIPLTQTCKAILTRCKHHAVYVFTFEQQRASHGRRKGERIPLTKTALKGPWRTCLDLCEIEDLRWHDIRHTTATRLLRKSGNLALVQALLRHDDITTTRKYSHTNINDLRHAMEESPDILPTLHQHNTN